MPLGPIVEPNPGPTFEIEVAAPEIEVTKSKPLKDKNAFLSLSGLDFVTSISGAATSISNVGPGLGSTIGPNGNFSSLPEISKWILSLGMILGRLELFAILVLFLPSFWRN